MSDREGGMSASVSFATCRDGPQCLHLAVTHADVPIMHIARRVTVTRHQLELIIDLQDTVGVCNNTVLIRTLDVFLVRAA